MENTDPIANFLRIYIKPIVKEAIKEALPKSEPNIDKQLSIDEAAALARVSKGTFRIWIKSGLMPAHGLGKKKFFFREEVIHAITSKQK
jgi:excisionase family DNA binding protein